MTDEEKWGAPNSPKRQLLAMGLVVEMSRRGGCRPSDAPSKTKQIEEADASALTMLEQVVKTW